MSWPERHGSVIRSHQALCLMVGGVSDYKRLTRSYRQRDRSDARCERMKAIRQSSSKNRRRLPGAVIPVTK